jgi:hypothetical protein
MRTLDVDAGLAPLPVESPHFTADVVEISLLLPGWQAAALESAAQRQGLTTASLVRRLIRDHCSPAGNGKLRPE